MRKRQVPGDAYRQTHILGCDMARKHREPYESRRKRREKRERRGRVEGKGGGDECLLGRCADVSPIILYT